MKPREPFGATVVCALAGVSYRQLDYWARTGLVRPSVRDGAGSGNQRLYSMDDLVLVRLIRRLSDAGVSLQWIRQALPQVQDALLRPPTGAVLIADGRQMRVVDDPEHLLHLIEAGIGIFVLSVAHVRAEMESRTARMVPA